MYFYEIHEADTDLFTDALLAHELEFDEDEFLGLVLEARQRVLDRFEEHTLVEAVANELQRGHGFIHVDDARLTAAVNVSEREGETFLAEVGAEPATALDEDADEDADQDAEDADEDLDFDSERIGLRSLRVTLDRNMDIAGDDADEAGSD